MQDKLFIDLIRVAIDNQICLSHTPSASEWGELYAMAKKQSLVGVCFAGVQRLASQYQAPPEKLYLKWMGMAAKIQQRNEVVNRQCMELLSKLSADGVRGCILKGQGVAALYRVGSSGLNGNSLNSSNFSSTSNSSSAASNTSNLSQLRQSGDIDVWVDGGVHAVVLFVSKYEKIEKLDNKHLHFHCFKDPSTSSGGPTDVELHWTPVCWYSSPKDRILQAFFDGERERQFGNVVDGLCLPTADFQLVHQLLHVYGHYVYEGVGMRQVMDLYFAQLACAKGLRSSNSSNSSNGLRSLNGLNGSDEFDKFNGLFKELGLMRFVAGTQWVLKVVFGMPDELLLCAPDEKEGKHLLDEIMLGGNFGHHNASNNVADESLVHRFYRRWLRKARMVRFDPWGVLRMPFARIKLEVWMRRKRKEYGV